MIELSEEIEATLPEQVRLIRNFWKEQEHARAQGGKNHDHPSESSQ